LKTKKERWINKTEIFIIFAAACCDLIWLFIHFWFKNFCLRWESRSKNFLVIFREIRQCQWTCGVWWTALSYSWKSSKKSVGIKDDIGIGWWKNKILIFQRINVSLRIESWMIMGGVWFWLGGLFNDCINEFSYPLLTLCVDPFSFLDKLNLEIEKPLKYRGKFKEFYLQLNSSWNWERNKKSTKSKNS
jgi:hypothetical protein